MVLMHACMHLHSCIHSPFVPCHQDLSGIPTVVKFAVLGLICLLSFAIRLFAVVRYESVIHEFDPYFNFRTTKYLASEGFLEFLDWFDDRCVRLRYRP